LNGARRPLSDGAFKSVPSASGCQISLLFLLVRKSPYSKRPATHHRNPLPDDTYSATERKAQDYTRMGVHTIWIIDPETRTGRMCIGDIWTAATRLEVPGTAIYVELPALFEALSNGKSSL